MGLSTERKLFVGVLVVAGAALVIDRGILGPSSASAAGELPIAGEQDSLLIESTVPTSKPQSNKSMAQVLMDRLDSLNSDASDHTLNSAFSLDQLLESSVTQPETTDSESAQTPLLSQIIPNEPDLPSLSALMPSANGGGGAVINGELVRVGQVGPDGFVLVEVRKRSVVLERDGRQFSVEMPMQIHP